MKEGKGTARAGMFGKANRERKGRNGCFEGDTLVTEVSVAFNFFHTSFTELSLRTFRGGPV